MAVEQSNQLGCFHVHKKRGISQRDSDQLYFIGRTTNSFLQVGAAKKAHNFAKISLQKRTPYLIQAKPAGRQPLKYGHGNRLNEDSLDLFVCTAKALKLCEQC